MIAAAGGEAFADLGVLELEVTEEEIRNDGTQSGKSYTLFVDTSNLDNMRMELPGEVVVATNRRWWVVDDGERARRPAAGSENGQAGHQPEQSFRSSCRTASRWKGCG